MFTVTADTTGRLKILTIRDDQKVQPYTSQAGIDAALAVWGMRETVLGWMWWSQAQKCAGLK